MSNEKDILARLDRITAALERMAPPAPAKPDFAAAEAFVWQAEPDAFLPVHAYMFSTAGAQIIEIVNMEEIAAEKQYEFAFLGFPLKLRGATGAPMPSYAVPLKN